MTQISIKETGLGNIQMGIHKLGPAVVGLAQTDLLETMQGVEKSYWGGEPGGYSVAERPGQTYQRTTNLRNSTYVMQTGLTVTIVSNAISPHGQPYSRFVLGDANGEGQAWFHQGRWPALATQVEEAADKLVVKLEHDTQDTIEAVGL
jgi:hypothetical protein